jgi:hypothetical protein
MDWIAWAAGLFEGEGTFGVFKNGKNSNPCTHMRIVMSDEDTVRKFHEVAGVGAVHGPQVMKNAKKLMWQWRCQKSGDIAILIHAFYPYLSIRRQLKADEILNYINNMPMRRQEV